MVNFRYIIFFFAIEIQIRSIQIKLNDHLFISYGYLSESLDDYFGILTKML